MAFIYVQTGTALKKVSTSGTITTLSLPTGVTIASGTRGRFAVLNKFVIFINAGSINLLIDPFDDAVRPVVPAPPMAPALVAEGTAAGQTGDYKVKYTFGIKDITGKLVAQSPFSADSNTVTLSNKALKASGLLTSDQTDVNVRRVYRTAAGGSEFYQWADLDGNTETVVEIAQSDELLQLLPAPIDLGLPPGTFAGGTKLELLVEWKGKLWGKAVGEGADIDTALWCERNKVYAWKPTSGLFIPPLGADEFGITAYIPRRDVLGICRRNYLYALDSANPAEASRRLIVKGVGCLSQESVQVIRDVAYFLGEDGVYQWDENGVQNITKDQVHRWFTTDTDFNRAEFKNARSFWNPVDDTYNLVLAAQGQTTLNRWISFSRQQRIWLGPHITAGFTINACSLTKDSNNVDTPVMADTTGFIHTMNSSTQHDSSSSAIDFDIEEILHHANTPDIEKLWLQPTIFTKIESAGTLTVTPTVGNINASAGTNILLDLTDGRSRERRIGHGQFMKFRFRNNEVDQNAEVRGYSIPFHELGRRR